jgi:UDP-N-acetylglucosamine 2-epimerase (non-hydrolysing)
MPEEINRIVTDAIVDLLFVTEESGRRNLLQEGVDARKIKFVGNTMIDSLARLTSSLPATESTERYLVVTLHRPSNVDQPDTLRELLGAIEEGAGEMQIRFPVHPRTRNVLKRSGQIEALEKSGQWALTEPVGYREFIDLVRSSAGVITDSGGIQEETTWLGVPCITLRQSTERPSTIETGTNRLIGTEPGMVRRAVADLASSSIRTDTPRPPLWDGRAAERIVQQVLQFLSTRT